MNLEENIRKLARSSYWQEIYSSSQKCSGIHLFNNINSFSGVQQLFLYWLRVYALLYEELSQLEWDNLDIKVIEDDLRSDAFLYWRSKQIETQLKEYKEKERQSKSKSKHGMKIYKGNKKEEG